LAGNLAAQASDGGGACDASGGVRPDWSLPPAAGGAAAGISSPFAFGGPGFDEDAGVQSTPLMQVIVRIGACSSVDAVIQMQHEYVQYKAHQQAHTSATVARKRFCICCNHYHKLCSLNTCFDV
jgi:hypothetical protein